MSTSTSRRSLSVSCRYESDAMIYKLEPYFTSCARWHMYMKVVEVAEEPYLDRGVALVVHVHQLLSYAKARRKTSGIASDGR